MEEAPQNAFPTLVFIFMDFLLLAVLKAPHLGGRSWMMCWLFDGLLLSKLLSLISFTRPPVWFLWLKRCYDCVVADPDFLWGNILKMLDANMPEEVYVWMSNLKRILTPLLERAMDLLRAVQ